MLANPLDMMLGPLSSLFSSEPTAAPAASHEHTVREFSGEAAAAQKREDAGHKVDASFFGDIGDPFKMASGVLKTIAASDKALESHDKGLTADFGDTRKSSGLVGSGLGALGGLFKMGKGVGELFDSKTRDKGVLDIAGGGTSLGSGLLGMLSPAKGGALDGLKSTLGPALSGVGGGINMVDAYTDYEKKGLTVDNFVKAGSGMSGMVSAGAGLLAGTTSAASVAGGGSAALALTETLAGGAFATGAPLALAAGAYGGTMANDYADRVSKEKGLFGQGNSASDAATRFGASEEEQYRASGFGSTSSFMLGGMASLGRGASNLGQSLWHGMFDDDSVGPPQAAKPIPH